MYIRKRVFIPFFIIILFALGSMIFFYFRTGQPPIFALLQKPLECDLLIKNGTVVDGSGEKPFKADIAVSGEKIVRVGKFRAEAHRVIDAKGLMVAPGFINPHSHIDQTILKNPDAEASLMQGVTTEIVGVDGLSVIDFDRHFDEVSKKGTGLNYGSLVGQGSVRQAVKGNSIGAATATEIASMQGLVKKAMEQGALGLSTGLEYVPGVYTATDEIIELAKAASPYEGVYVSHIRNERDKVLEAVREALEIAKAAKLTAVISHIKVGSSVYDTSREQIIAKNTAEVIAAINDFRKEGGKAYADIYPYRVPWFQINKSPGQVVWKYPHEMILVSASENQGYVGRTVAEIASADNITPETVVKQLLADPSARVCVQNISEASIQQLLKAPFTVVGMDNNLFWGDPSYIPPQHPRNYGTYPRVLGHYVRSGLLTIEEAVHKMTGHTAKIYGLEKRGTIKEGNYADLVIFDPATISDMATYWQPRRYPKGIEYVIVNGQTAVSRGKYVYTDIKNGPEDNRRKGVRAGKIIRR